MKRCKLFPACHCYVFLNGHVVPTDGKWTGEWRSLMHNCELAECEWPQCCKRGKCAPMYPDDGFASCAAQRAAK